VLLITGVGSLIHVYSIGYMDARPDKRRFFAYLNLFVAAMLLLVLADNYLLLFVGWEGVGLASYLLIGFWQYKPAYASRPRRRPSSSTASVTSGLSMAIMVMFVTFGGVDFPDVFSEVGHRQPGGT
jgi:NADH-quinone oxidoreductase subunit L